MAKNVAEQHFEDYLAARGLAFEYEREAGGSHPDYWVETPAGLVVCEVRHVTAVLGGPGGNSSGWFDPYKPLAKAVKAKSRQGRGLDSKCPYVVVLWAPGWDVGDFAVSGALFGNPRMVMPVDVATGTADADQLHNEFGLEAVMHHDVRAHISAVGMLRRFNPTSRAAEDEVEELLNEIGRDDLVTTVSTVMDVYQRRHEGGGFDPDAREPRLVTFHNPQATTALRQDLFNGPFDEQWAAANGEYKRVTAGSHVEMLPK